MFTFSLLVPIAQDKDLELSYCIPSVRIIGSSQIVVISQDTTFLPSFLSFFDVNRTSRAQCLRVFLGRIVLTRGVHSLVSIICGKKLWKMAAHNFDRASNMLSIMPIVTGHTVIPPGVVGGSPVLLPQTHEYSNNSFKVLCTCFSESCVELLHLCRFTRD